MLVCLFKFAPFPCKATSRCSAVGARFASRACFLCQQLSPSTSQWVSGLSNLVTYYLREVSRVSAINSRDVRNWGKHAPLAPYCPSHRMAIMCDQRPKTWSGLTRRCKTTNGVSRYSFVCFEPDCLRDCYTRPSRPFFSDRFMFARIIGEMKRSTQERKQWLSLQRVNISEEWNGWWEDGESTCE